MSEIRGCGDFGAIYRFKKLLTAKLGTGETICAIATSLLAREEVTIGLTRFLVSPVHSIRKLVVGSEIRGDIRHLKRTAIDCVDHFTNENEDLIFIGYALCCGPRRAAMHAR